MRRYGTLERQNRHTSATSHGNASRPFPAKQMFVLGMTQLLSRGLARTMCGVLNRCLSLL